MAGRSSADSSERTSRRHPLSSDQDLEHLYVYAVVRGGVTTPPRRRRPRTCTGSPPRSARGPRRGSWPGSARAARLWPQARRRGSPRPAQSARQPRRPLGAKDRREGIVLVLGPCQIEVAARGPEGEGQSKFPVREAPRSRLAGRPSDSARGGPLRCVDSGTVSTAVRPASFLRCPSKHREFSSLRKGTEERR